MSSKNSIILTAENEHWYHDCSEPLTKFNEKPYKDVITMEFNKNNIRIDVDDNENLIISIINPNCELYKIISNINQD
jgi:hypothetical protein